MWSVRGDDEAGTAAVAMPMSNDLMQFPPAQPRCDRGHWRVLWL